MSEAHFSNYPKNSSVVGILNRSMIPPRHLSEPYERGAHARFDAAFGAMGRTLNDCGIVIAIGRRGTGKTQAAAWYSIDLAVKLQGWRPNDTPIVYATAKDLFTSLRADQNDAKAVDKFLAADLLIIDEFQVRYDTEFERDWLTYLVDKRYGLKRPTLLMGNVVPNAIVETLGTSIVDRCREGGIVILFDWDSFRGNL